MSSIENYLHETPEKMSEILTGAKDLFATVKNVDLKKIVITGSGTSYHAGLQMAPLLREVMNVEVISLYPFMVTKETFLNDSDKTLVIGISQGGSSYSTYTAMRTAKEAGCITASMAGSEGAYIDEQADYVLTVHCGEELAGAKTKGYYCTKLNLLLFGIYWGLEHGKINQDAFDSKVDAVKDSIDHFEDVYAAGEKWIDENLDTLKNTNDIRITGPESLYGDTLESALKLLETLRCPVTGYEFEEFIHGIYNAVNENSTVFILDNGEEKRTQKMKEVLSEWSSNIFIISNKQVDYADLYVPTTQHEGMETFNFIIPLQLMCSKVPHALGYDPSKPKDPEFHMKLGSKKFNK